MKLLVYDLETTGLYWWQHAIHQLSAMLVIDGEVVDELDLRMRPFEGAKVDPVALVKCRVTEEEIMQYPDPAKQFRVLINFLREHVDPYDKTDKIHLLGFNNRKFDDSFLSRLFVRNGADTYPCYFWPDGLDVLVLASMKFRHRRAELPSFQLRRVAKELGIEVDETKLHDARYDLQLTYEAFKILENEQG